MVKKILTILICIVVVGGSFYSIISWYKSYNKSKRVSIKLLDNITARFNNAPQFVKEKFHITSKDSLKRSSVKKVKPEKVALHFKDGSVMVGDLIGKTDMDYHVMYKGEETIVFKEMVDFIDAGEKTLRDKANITDEEITEHWPYENSIVIRLKNNRVVDAEIINVTKKTLALSYKMGDGFIEQELPRQDIDYLIFKPVSNGESMKIEESLKALFPKMSFYRFGNFTIVTDSYVTWVKECRTALRALYTDIYFEFFELFKDRSPVTQNYIVIFDDYYDFIEHGIVDGVPAWLVAGYFKPEDKTLYLFNILGEKFSGMLFEGMVGESGKAIDDIVDKVEGEFDKKYHVFIEGHAKKIKDRFWEAYGCYQDMFDDATMSTLRHEFAHEIFNNWGIQNITLSKFTGPNEELVKMKKEFLDTKDNKRKSEILKTIMTQKGDRPSLDMKAANSWLSEGIATYCELGDFSKQNNTWLFAYQDMKKKRGIYPLEFLTNYSMGSFPGVYQEAMLDLYAQSWAFVTFLMNRYPTEFIAYQKKLSENKAKGQDDIAWLLQSLGKDSKTLNNEFEEWMNRYPSLEDPFVTLFVKIYDIFNKY